MQNAKIHVNLCIRLINETIKKGVKYTNNYGHQCSAVPLGLLSNQPFVAGDIIHILSGELLLSPTTKSIHIGNNMHVLDTYGRFINHSCEPNAKINNNMVVAIKDIQMYEEITCNKEM